MSDTDPSVPPPVTTTADGVCAVCGTTYTGRSTCPTCGAERTEQDAPLAWFVPMCTTAAGIAFATAHAPARIKLLGLFLVAVGLGIGAVSGWLARLYAHHRPRVVLAATFVVTAVALVGSTLESHRLWAEPIRAARHARDTPFAGEPDALREEAARTLATKTSFAAFVRQRVGQLGRWSAAAAFAFLTIEVLLGAACSVWSAQRVGFAVSRRPTGSGSA